MADQPSPSSPFGIARTPNPFVVDVCTSPFEVTAQGSVTELNKDIVERVASALDDLGGPAGRPLLLLTAPRAGYGKTHLLGRVAATSQAVAMPLSFRSDSEVTWSLITTDALQTLAQMPGTEPEWTRLREICTGVFSSLVVRLIDSGRLPCANREQAMRVLGTDPNGLFRDGSPSKLIGDWLRKHFGQLREPLSEMARKLCSAGPMNAWMDALFAHANHGTPTTADTVISLAAGSREAFQLWLKMVSLWHPAVLLVDHLDGFYRHEKAGVRIATILLELASQEGVHVVLSLNQDVWQATFAHHLPSALEDRLTASQFLLRGLSAQDATEMVCLRLRGASIEETMGGRFIAFLNVAGYFQNRPSGSVSARAFLRHCAENWRVFQQMLERGENPVAPAALLTEAPQEPSDDPVPEISIFGKDDASFMKTAAAGLAEPVPAMVNTPFIIHSAPPPPMSLAEPSSPFIPVETPPPAAEHSNGANPPLAPAAPQQQPHGPGALEHLREMMDRLRRQTPQSTVSPTQPLTATAPASSPIAARLAGVMGENTPPPAMSQDALLGRFEALRMQMAGEAEHRPLDMKKLGDLIRLAGKRFLMVKYDEVQLPGLADKIAPRWTLQDQEILFGIQDFNDRGYWRTLAEFVSGRMASLASENQVKLVALKSDRETLSWTSLLGGQVIPDALRSRIEALHLDTRSIAALYAMQRMVNEAESGTINASPAQVMSVLARELDFFWKRVTRPLPSVA